MLLVIKLGGSILKDGASSSLIADLKKVVKQHRVVLVHGGGVEVTEIASKLGKEQKFVLSPEGFRSRYTDKETIEIYTMVMAGKLNKQIVLALQSQNIDAVGLSGLDASLLRAERKLKLIIIDERGRKKVIDGGYTGKITQVNTEFLTLLLEKGYVPVVTPIALSPDSEPLNVDGDRTAAIVAGALKADMLLMITDVAGLMLKDEYIPKITTTEVKEVLSTIGGGMSTKIHAGLEALNQGVSEVLITSGTINQPLTLALNHQVGTVIKK
ncbi:[LysW]-aminoadipate/[LysW]-glutamate kinase [Candidatus Bathycorpusculum sp.]|uniref:[LysW]-aminoadipate/[LysW]-glutamate kinase n=1 Tax=Candidatus Bathycorpusculum sp. TaxID=2994959 RepID=UPI0028345F09|nr:[LysW]-aminoadipate/[LysW]-glutamate kinase [Candidatus Termitimicrobium sp.]MCL2431002.1 [LysW]-aminoadipate/[LysW]-glutamate kinase [Candidatus Termitimicrobium sp.]